MKRIALIGLVIAPGVAAAQGDGGAPFTGVYAGPEASLQEHGFTLETTGTSAGTRHDTEYSRTGLAAGRFAGFDLAVAARLRLGIEAGATVGGGAGGRAELAGGDRYEQRPRWGYRAVARLGVVLGARTLIYATGGYGAQRYRLRTSIFIDNMREWLRGGVVGIGVEHRIARAASIRLDARHVADAANQLSIGVPIRF